MSNESVKKLPPVARKKILNTAMVLLLLTACLIGAASATASAGPHIPVVPGSITLATKADVRAAIARSCQADHDITNENALPPTPPLPSRLFPEEARAQHAPSSCDGMFVVGGILTITGPELTHDDLVPLLSRVVGVRASVVVTSTSKLTTLASLANMEFISIALKLRDNKALQSACGLAGLVGSHMDGLQVKIHGNKHTITLPRALAARVSSHDSAALLAVEYCDNEQKEQKDIKGETEKKEMSQEIKTENRERPRVQRVSSSSSLQACAWYLFGTCDRTSAYRIQNVYILPPPPPPPPARPNPLPPTDCANPRKHLDARHHWSLGEHDGVDGWDSVRHHRGDHPRV